jgi:hypothetical protein
MFLIGSRSIAIALSKESDGRADGQRHQPQVITMPGTGDHDAWNG